MIIHLPPCIQLVLVVLIHRPNNEDNTSQSGPRSFLCLTTEEGESGGKGNPRKQLTKEVGRGRGSRPGD